VASDINEQSLANVRKILSSNPALEAKISLRLQPNKHHIFTDIIHSDEHFDVTLCNPPFHSSAAEARKSSQRKVHNLAQNKQQKSGQKTVTSQHNEPTPALNFGGFDVELWCSGGEKLFLKKLIRESQDFKTQCHWFSSLVSKAENLKDAKKQIQKLGATDLREIEMTQGNKITRIVVWTFQ
jgi:23S rRNA (adenine1618-N6)-methyltransferase